MTAVAIIQARMGSTRLPGKVMLDIAGRSNLARVVSRISRARLINDVVIATTTSPADDVVAAAAEQLGTKVFRGSEHDVLSRFYFAALHFRADAVVRITSDCPLIDPEVADRVIENFLAKATDYASNCIERTYPRGLDTEVISFEALMRANQVCREAHQREHVTPLFYERPDLFRVASICAEQDFSQYRWTLDTPEDLKLIRAIYSYFAGRDSFSWRDVVALMRARPEFAAINSHVMQKSVHDVAAVN